MSDENGENLSANQQALLESGERVSFAARCTRAAMGATRIDSAFVVLTKKRLIASKDKLLGKPKADISVPWSQVTKVVGEPWSVDWTKIELVFQTQAGPVPIIEVPNTTYEIEVRGRSLYVSAREGSL